MTWTVRVTKKSCYLNTVQSHRNTDCIPVGYKQCPRENSKK